MPTTTDSHGAVQEVEWTPPTDPALLDNYAALRAERGWTWDQIADAIAAQDEPLAGFVREHGPEHDAAAEDVAADQVVAQPSV